MSTPVRSSSALRAALRIVARVPAVALAVLGASLIAACAGKPPPPSWQGNAMQAVDQAVEAYLSGDSAAEVRAFDRARTEIGSTGRIDLVARAELMRCAARTASLVFESCEGFERLRNDAPAAEQAYAEHLAARPLPRASIDLLPGAQRLAASAVAGGVGVPAAGMQAIEDPLSRLIGIAVLFQTGKSDPALVALATDTASAQGWRRPLLAWLNVQAMLAEKNGQAGEADRLRRRIELVQAGR